MSLKKTETFVADIESQYEWYATHAGWDVADRYLDAVESSCRLLELHPLLGPCAGFSHPRLQDWHFFAVFRPFSKHLLFYEVVGDDLILRRAMHGHRDLPDRLIDS